MDKYLLHILHDVNTIIIPGLGALTVTNVKTGEMMFMSYLKYDDGKLSAYISEKEGMSENDAKNLIAKYVREIQAKLDKGDTYDMFQFGRFLKNKDGDIDFESWGTYASTETALSSGNQDLNIQEQSVVASDEVAQNPEILVETEVVVPEEITPEEKPEIAAETFISEEQPHTEDITTPEFVETAQTEDLSTEDDGILDDLTILPTPSQNTSLDEILEKSEETVSVEESPAQPETTQESSKPDLIADQTQDESRVQVENIYIPPSEVIPEAIVETEKPAPDLNKKKDKTKQPETEPKLKKKRGVGFWILIVLIILVAGGGTTTLLFYDQVKTYLPFLESKRAEAEEKKDSAVSAEELNANAEALEAAESERVAGENQQEVVESEQVVEEAVVVEETPVAQPVATSNDDSKPYHVIGGAFASKENADRYAAKNSGSVLGQYDGMYLVSLGSYASKQEANSAISGKGWVFKMK